ncbi:MAG: hypothetical protein ABIK79_10980 [Chloroflexota bacterium]|nr:hypothetical protein [Anaerolineae bacterium]
MTTFSTEFNIRHQYATTEALLQDGDVDAIGINNDRPPVPGRLEDWNRVKVVDAAYQSSRTGEVVEVCPPHGT